MAEDTPTDIPMMTNTQDEINITNADEIDENDDFDSVLHGYVLPSCYFFITYGPFVVTTDQLSLLLIDDNTMTNVEGS